jgi:hypothetical protein
MCGRRGAAAGGGGGLSVRIHEHMHAYVYACIHTRIHACIHACMHTWVDKRHDSIRDMTLSNVTYICYSIPGLIRDMTR